MVSPSFSGVKFNVNGASRGKPGQAGIGGVLRNSKGEVLLMFSKYMSVCNSNKVKVLAILEALGLFLSVLKSMYLKLQVT